MQENETPITQIEVLFHRCKERRLLYTLFSLFLLSTAIFSSLSGSTSTAEFQEIKVPTIEKGLFGSQTVNLTVKLYLPRREGRHPVVIINHGRPRDKYDARTFTANFRAQSEFFISKGFVVANPLRRGYGTSEGSLSDSSGKCDSPNYFDSIMENVSDIKAVIEYLKQQPYIDPERIVLVGQSVGGMTAVAYGSKYPKDIIGAINFSGGHGSTGSGTICKPALLAGVFGDFGKNNPLQTLWIYAEDDSYFDPLLVKQMHEQYTSAGGRAKLIFAPKEGFDHHIFTKGMEVWKPWVTDYLKSLSLLKD